MTGITPTILSIAGSDPSGGAGIQADLKTIAATGSFGAAAITCLTVQNSKGVQEIFTPPASFVRKQIEAVLSDNHVTHIKIGMLGTLELVGEICDVLKSFPGEIVYDPVLASTAGQGLFDQKNIVQLKNSLLDIVTVLTPNKFELEILAGKKSNTEEELLKISQEFLESLPDINILIVKGGHFKEERPTLTDFMLTKSGAIIKDKRKRHENINLHGTGCTYAAAFASFHSLTNDYELSFRNTGSFMDELIEKSMDHRIVKNHCNGPLLHHLLCKS